ncbi:PIN domain-containing protein [Aureivirga marina]|uniref:PIN domain-containing protein n=1 Tax=Aureivirga marina TaxID=1182451 RepID=UPI0018CA8179|nr:PIN domain-containing protein [Aureivirga marina]
MKEKIIFDTNTIRNTDINHFLGGRSDLHKFLKHADIIIPKIVLEEVKRQKKKKLREEKDKFLSNSYSKLLGIDPNSAKEFDIDNYIHKLESEEEIPFTSIEINDTSVLNEMTQLAIKKLPPFESKDNTDKGFKDAVIYFSILEYLKNHSSNEIFVCVKDIRLKEALDKHIEIKIIENYDEFLKMRSDQFDNEYFISQVAEYLNCEVKLIFVKGYYLNINDDKVVQVNKEDDEFLLIVDSGEIIESIKKEKVRIYIDKLINSSNFENTHHYVGLLNNEGLHFLSLENMIRILQASIDNTQIAWIIDDEDVKELIGKLYDVCKNQIKDDLRERLSSIFEIKIV